MGAQKTGPREQVSGGALPGAASEFKMEVAKRFLTTISTQVPSRFPLDSPPASVH